MLVSERFEKSSRVVRDLTAKLRRHQVFATSNLVAICEIERQLAVDFRRRGNFAESRALLMDSLDLLDGRRSGAVEPDVDEAYARALMELGRVAHDQQRFDEALVCFQRARRHWKAWSTIRDTWRSSSPSTKRNERSPRCSVVAAWKSRGGGFWSRTFACLSSRASMAGPNPRSGSLPRWRRLDLAPDQGAMRKAPRRDPEIPGQWTAPAPVRRATGAMDCQRRPAVSARPQSFRRIERSPRPGCPGRRRYPSDRVKMCRDWRSPVVVSRRGLSGGLRCRQSGRGSTTRGPPGRCPPDRRVSLGFRQDIGTKRF